MRRTDFSSQAPGQLVPAADGAEAFVPAGLRPEVELSWDLLRAIDDARAVISELTGQARLIKNIDLVIRPLARREAVLSSRIEGTRTEVRDLLLSEAAGEAPEEDTDIYEVFNYLATIDLAQEWFADGRRLDSSLVKELHSRLLLGVRGADKRPGAYRAQDVYIGNRAEGIHKARFIPPPVERIPALMEDWLAFSHEDSVYSPLVDAAIAHYQFEAIHPFEDGNGRLGRLLVPLHLMQEGVLDRPLLYLSPVLLDEDRAYRDGLLAVSTEGAWTEWIIFMLRAMKVAAADALGRVQRVMELHEQYQQKVRTATNSKYPILALELVMDRAFVSVPDVVQFAETTYPTAKSAIETLQSLGVLVPHGRIRGRQIWRAEELLREVYD